MGSTDRALLGFDGIAFHARISLNGVDLGPVGPYTEHAFDITEHLRAGLNDLRVRIHDLTPEADGSGRDAILFGMGLGWEAYGGIIREVWLEVRPATSITHVRFGYRLDPPFDDVSCPVVVTVASTEATSGVIRIALVDGDVEVASTVQTIRVGAGTSETTHTLTLRAPTLWSPSRPHLYRLVTQLTCDASEDSTECRTGFRHLETRGPAFILNGEPLVLHGVSWLGTWRDQGFTLTRDQIAHDLQSIKAMGANAVRLHLFPQDRAAVELADELGLFVLEEPGFWQVDFHTLGRSQVELGFEILERTIRRDGNSPSVFAWLLANESQLTVEFLREGYARAKDIDPIGRFVSCANDHVPAGIRAIFDDGGLDFYTAHPYDRDPDEMDVACGVFGTDKPLLFDEWGGRQVGQSPYDMAEQSDRILDLIDTGRLAGELFFSWNDFRQVARLDGEVVDGVCLSGIVTEAREVRPEVRAAVERLFAGRRSSDGSSEHPPVVAPEIHVPRDAAVWFEPIDLQPLVTSDVALRAWDDLEHRIVEHWETNRLTRGHGRRVGGQLAFWADQPLAIDGVPFRAPLMGGRVRPLVVTLESSAIDIPVGGPCVRLHVLGQVTLPTGYPIAGTDADVIASYVVRYADGNSDTVELRNGIEVVSGSLIHQASVIAPTPSLARPAITWVRDPARERYQASLLSIDTGDAVVESLVVRLEPDGLPLLLFALTAERAGTR